jgi:transcription-repair coupling factor (superfamily II helicase)
VENLFYQLKVKIMATKAGFSSVSIENGQLILRYPKGVEPPQMAVSYPQVRVGKTALWVRLPAEFEDWSEFLLNLLGDFASNLKFSSDAIHKNGDAY